MLVGDSLNQNQFESLLCLIHEGLPDKSGMNEIHGYRISRGKGYYAVKFLYAACELANGSYLVRHFKKMECAASELATNGSYLVRHFKKMDCDNMNRSKEEKIHIPRIKWQCPPNESSGERWTPKL